MRLARCTAVPLAGGGPEQGARGVGFPIRKCAPALLPRQPPVRLCIFPRQDPARAVVFSGSSRWSGACKPLEKPMREGGGTRCACPSF